MHRLRNLLLMALVHAALPAIGSAKSISVNFSALATGDNQLVDPGETSVTGIAEGSTVDGAVWNNLRLLASGTSGAPATFTAGTQGGNDLNLIDSTGTASGVKLTSSGPMFSNTANVSGAGSAATGDGGLMHGILLFSSVENVALSGLSAWAPNGYKVVACFDIGALATRTYGISITDGTVSQAYWTADSSGTDSDTNNDGVMVWKKTTASTIGTAVADANHAVFGNFSGDTLTISGTDPSLRSVISGFQIIANTGPAAEIVSFTISPATFSAGEPVTLAWETQDAESVTISQGVGTVAASGTLSVSPTANTTWTLTAVRGDTTVSAQVTASLTKGKIDVYLLSGQSNMQGTARTSKLPADLLSIPEIRLYAAGTGVGGSIANQWVGLQPANGTTFGPEIGIGERMRALRPGRPIALLKYAQSGHSLEINFRPGANAGDTANWGPSFTGLVNTVNNGIAALEADGWQPVIHGMCWLQGEQDAKDGFDASESNTSADDYGTNLRHFAARIREQFAAHAAPGGIRFAPCQVLAYAPPGGDVQARFPGRDLVRQAVLAADEDSGAPLSISNTRSIPTNPTDHPSHAQEVDGHRDTDEVHLNATALLAIGRSMAYAMLGIEPGSYQEWAASFGLEGGPTDDDDGDSLSNLLEAFLGTDPGKSSTGITAISTDGTTVNFTHPQAATPPVGVVGSYVWSLDLESWYAADGVQGPMGGPTVTIPAVVPVAGVVTATATASTPLDRLYLRINVGND